MPSVDPTLRDRLQVTFGHLQKKGAAAAFPGPLALSEALATAMPPQSQGQIQVKPGVAAMFATASVDVWQRAVHSFLISASLTEASPIWASVSGYYASHYCMRAFAHLLGYFHLFRQKRVVQLDLQGGCHFCSFTKKQRSDREHQFYWRVVKRDMHFGSDPLFTENQEDADPSDAAHRGRANYGDHLRQLPNFRPLDEGSLKRRVDRISRIAFSVPPIPRRARFPDIESVQIVAYHRVVRFRRFLDEALGKTSRFWNVHRTPAWTNEVTDFQLAEQSGLGSLAPS